MGNNQTFWRQDISEMAYHYENNETKEYCALKAMPLKSLALTKGSYRVPDEDKFFNQPDLLMSRSGYPHAFNFGDHSEDYLMLPYGGSVELGNDELANAKALGYQSEAEMIRQNMEWLASKAKLDYEIRWADFLKTEANYETDYVIDVGATAANKWSALNTSDPLANVIEAFELIWGTPTDMIIGKQMAWKLMQHPKITGSSFIAGAKRTGLDPKVTPEYLSGYFGIPNIWIPGGILNSTPNTPATMTKGYIWNPGYVWIGILDKSAAFNPKIESFANALTSVTPEMKLGNFIAKETVDQRKGGIGFHTFDLVFYAQFKTRQKRLGVLLKNCY